MWSQIFKKSASPSGLASLTTFEPPGLLHLKGHMWVAKKKKAGFGYARYRVRLGYPENCGRYERVPPIARPLFGIWYLNYLVFENCFGPLFGTIWYLVYAGAFFGTLFRSF